MFDFLYFDLKYLWSWKFFSSDSVFGFHFLSALWWLIWDWWTVGGTAWLWSWYTMAHFGWLLNAIIWIIVVILIAIDWGIFLGATLTWLGIAVLWYVVVKFVICEIATLLWNFLVWLVITFIYLIIQAILLFVGFCVWSWNAWLWPAIVWCAIALKDIIVWFIKFIFPSLAYGFLTEEIFRIYKNWPGRNIYPIAIVLAILALIFIPANLFGWLVLELGLAIWFNYMAITTPRRKV